MSVLAFDMGGTRLKGGVMSDDGQPSMTIELEINGDFHLALSYIAGARTDLMRNETYSRVALCVPGLVNEDGVVVSLPGKLEGIEGFDLRGFVRREFDLEAVVVNDAVAYGSGEAAFGAGRGFSNVVVVTIGTGVGVTVLKDGVPLTDGVFGAGILGGQIPISEAVSGPTDTSGHFDTIEALCRANRIVDYASGSFETVPDVFEAFTSGDSTAIAAIETYRGHLVRALVALAHAHAPEVIVVGGGPMGAGTPLLEGVEEKVNSRLFGTYRVKVRPAALPDIAALAGLARISRG